MAVIPSRYCRNEGSMTMMSGSGYISGGAWRPHCRGGLVMTDGGVPVAAAGCCARATAGARAAAPIVPTSPLTMLRLDAAGILVMLVSSRLVGRILGRDHA